MKKYAVLLIGLLSVQIAYAQFLFNCVDQHNRPAASMTLSAESQITSGTQQVCEGGYYGDPMVCHDKPFQGEKKLLKVDFFGSSTEFMVGRTLWEGTPIEDWEYFKGAGNLKDSEYMISLDYADGFSGYQYVLTIAPAGSSASSLGRRLNCRKW